nr:MAG TPA: DNA polymerase [Bacteriophage sp.]
MTFINYEDRTNEIVIINNRAELIQFYNNHKDDIFISYNGRQYDTGILKGILDGMNVGYVNDKLIKEGKKPFQVVKNAKKYPFNDYDTILKDKSLKQLEAFMGDDIRETEVDFNISRPLTDVEIQQTLYYNHHDVIEVLRVLDYCWDDFEGQLDIIELYGLDMSYFTKTKVQLASKILNAVSQHTLDDEFEIRIPDTIKLSDKYKFITEWYLNPKNWRYKEYLHSEDDQHNNQLCCIVAGIPHVFAWGGCHGADDKQAVFEGIILHADVSSMYPTTDIEYGLLSRKFKNPDDFRQMRDFRLKLKADGDSKNKALKPMINGVYGASKDRNNPCYDPLMANLTCVFGQMFILDLIDKLEPYCRLLQTNTDGIFVLCKNEEMKNKVIEITNEVGKRLRMEFEIDEYTKLIQKDVNNYIAVMKNGKLECKGAMVKFNKPIDNDLPILNDAVRNYLAEGIPVEETINNCTDYIKFQKVIKLSAKYKEIWYGNGVAAKDGKITSINGELLKGKVHRVFASKRTSDGSIYKLKVEKGVKSYEQFANTPAHLFIDNEDIHNKNIPEYLDKEYYINEAKKRIDMFLTKDKEKVDKNPVILFKCMSESPTFYDFLEKCSENKITKKILEQYLIADCCSNYGKTKKLLLFRDYFLLLYKKDKINLTTLNKKFSDDKIKSIILLNSELSKTGKSYTNLDSKKCLLEIFDIIPNEHIDIYDIMEMQINKFGTVRYKDSLMDNRYFVLNTRNVIAPNLTLYNIGTGEIEYRKIKKEIFKILPLQDGDIIDVKNCEKQFDMKIIGKDDEGKNILAANIDKEYDVITQYEIVYRKYNKKHSLLIDREEC